MRSLLVVFTALATLLAGLAHAEVCPVSGVQAQMWNQSLKFPGGSLPKSPWFLSPCSVGFPSGQHSCGQSATGFFGKWNSPAFGGGCIYMLNNQTQPWVAIKSSAGDGFRATFMSHVHYNIGDITILCDATASNLEPVGDAVENILPSRLVKYTLILKSNAIC